VLAEVRKRPRSGREGCSLRWPVQDAFSNRCAKATYGSRRDRQRPVISISAAQSPIWWAWLDLNQRPHLHQLSRVQRCADRRFPRSRPSVRVKGCVLSDLVPTRCRQARKATHSRPGTAAYLCPPLPEAWPADGWGPSTTRGERSRSRVAPTPASTPRGRGRGPTPTQTAAVGDPDPDRNGTGDQRHMASSSAPPSSPAGCSAASQPGPAAPD
jgi:hypothetical protein